MEIFPEGTLYGTPKKKNFWKNPQKELLQASIRRKETFGSTRRNSWRHALKKHLDEDHRWNSRNLTDLSTRSYYISSLFPYWKSTLLFYRMLFRGILLEYISSHIVLQSIYMTTSKDTAKQFYRDSFRIYHFFPKSLQDFLE